MYIFICKLGEYLPSMWSLCLHPGFAIPCPPAPVKFHPPPPPTITRKRLTCCPKTINNLTNKAQHLIGRDVMRPKTKHNIQKTCTHFKGT